MARGNRQLVWITPVHFDRHGRPVDPDYGIDEGAYPDQGLPGSGWGGPVDPGFGRPGARPPHPGQGLPHPGRPVDPGWGINEGGESGQLPVWPIGPDQGLPPVPGQPLPPTDPPPGTIWPPLPPSVPAGKAMAAVMLASSAGGVVYRYVVIDVPPPAPDQGLPGGGSHPDQGLPQPPTAQRD